MIVNIDKNLSMTPEASEPQPEFKKIQDYIYKFSDQIGMGNFSKVFKGVHQTSNKQVAIKIIQLSSLSNGRLQQLLNSQTKILKMLSHPNVIGCEEILSSVRNCYIITELCNGGDLERKLRKAGHFKEKEIYQVAVDIYEGLKYLSKKSIIHRDIKVSNIFINKGIYKIADFGFAQISQVQFKDISVGSPIYMSPEGYINNVYGPKTDIWAFGVLLYELVEGKTPCFDCRTETQLKQKLLKQIDYSNFTSHISNQLKNLIIQCLQVNPANRIKVQEIQNTQWMKKAISMTTQMRRLAQKENHVQKNSNISSSQKYRKISQDLHQKTNNDNQLQNQVYGKGHDTSIKNYLEKVNKLIRNSQKGDLEQRRKHSTLDKTKLSKDDSSEKQREEGKVFFSPKNIILNYEKNLGFKNNNSSSQNPQRFESFTIANNLPSPDHSHLKINTSKNENVKHYASTKEESRLVKIKNNWIEKNAVRDGKETPTQKQSHKSHKEKDKNGYVNHNITNSGDLRQKFQDKQVRKFDHNIMAMTADYKNYLSVTPQHKMQTHQRSTPRSNQQSLGIIREKNTDHIGTKASFFSREGSEKQEKSMKQQIQKHEKLSHQPKSQKKSAINKVISRRLKFADCIGIIHYCRLCYKFACLLDQTGESSNSKHFLTSWSVQLLVELNSKMDQSEVLFGNQSCMINNPSVGVGEIEKKRKLKDVTEEYLNKYSKALRNVDRNHIGIKQASSFIYNLYIQKGCQYKEKTKDKKPYLYYALIGYISILDRETRNLMQFLFEIKNSMQCKQVQKLLNIKITEFNHKTVQEITNELPQQGMRDSQKK